MSKPRIRTGKLPPWGGAVPRESEVDAASRIVHAALERAVYAPEPGVPAASALTLWLPPAAQPGATFFGVDRSKLEPMRLPTLEEALLSARRNARAMRHFF